MNGQEASRLLSERAQRKLGVCFFWSGGAMGSFLGWAGLNSGEGDSSAK